MEIYSREVVRKNAEDKGKSEGEGNSRMCNLKCSQGSHVAHTRQTLGGVGIACFASGHHKSCTFAACCVFPS